MIVENIDTTNMCSHLRHKLMDADGIYHHVWQTIQDNPELTAVSVPANSISTAMARKCWC